VFGPDRIDFPPSVMTLVGGKIAYDAGILE